MSFSDYIGRFHPVLVHLPIGILLAAIFLECLSHVKGFRKIRRTIRILLLLGFLAAFASSLTGYLHAQSGEFDPDLVIAHRNLGIAVTIFSFLAFLLKGKKKTEIRLGYFTSLFALTILIFLTGHSGGSITHGAGFLKMPGAVDAEKSTMIEIKPEALLYADLVAPILKKNCTSCHGPSRQKGKLRLDQPDYIQKGGKDGKILKESRPEEGEMWRRLALDPRDEDHMPPKEKSPLSKSEISLITYWLQTGADYAAPLSSLPRADSIINLLQGTRDPAPPQKISEPVAIPSLQILDEFRQAGVAISFLSYGDGRLSLSFINADQKKISSLLPRIASLNTQLVEIKMPARKLLPGQWQFLKSLPDLKRLSVENSNFSDADLSALTYCQNLSYLNLMGTSVTAKGLAQISMKALRHLYLFKTSVSMDELGPLQTHFPTTEIVLGNFEVPTLESDTMERKTKYVVPK